MDGRAALWLLAAAVLWGTTGTAQALGGAEGSPLAVGAMRLVIGSAGLWGFGVRSMVRPPWRWLTLGGVARRSTRWRSSRGSPGRAWRWERW